MVEFTNIMCLTLALTQRDDSRNNMSYIAYIVDEREIVMTCGSMFVSVSISMQIPQKERKKERKKKHSKSDSQGTFCSIT